MGNLLRLYGLPYEPFVVYYTLDIPIGWVQINVPYLIISDGNIRTEKRWN